MKPGAYRRSAYLLIACLALIFTGCSKQEPAATSTQAYEKDGVSLTMPAGWEVFEDTQRNTGLRSIAVVTDVGSIATVDIYTTASYDKSLPTLDEYSKGYLQSSLDHEEARAKALIDYGEASRGGSQGVFYDVTLPQPFNVQYFLEVYRKGSAEKLAYITFNTPQEQLKAVQPYIDEFVHYANLGQ